MNPGFIQNGGAGSEQPVFEFKTYQAMASGGGSAATIPRGSVLAQDVLGASAAAATYTNDGGRLDVIQNYIAPNGGTNGNPFATARPVKVGVLLDETATSGAVGQARLALEGDIEARVVAHTGAAAANIVRGTPLTAFWNTSAQAAAGLVGSFKIAVAGEPIHAYAVARAAGVADPFATNLVASGGNATIRVRLIGYSYPQP